MLGCSGCVVLRWLSGRVCSALACVCSNGFTHPPNCRLPRLPACPPAGMISGALLATYCPDNGQCRDREEEPDGGGGGSSPARRLLATTVQRGGSWLQGFAAAGGGGAGAAGLGDGEAAGPPPPPGVTCDGRMLWLIVGCITLSSPLLVLLTQVGVAACMRVCVCAPCSTRWGCWLADAFADAAAEAETASGMPPGMRTHRHPFSG